MSTHAASSPNALSGSKGAQPVNLRSISHSAEQSGNGRHQIGRITNLMQLTVDYQLVTRYAALTEADSETPRRR